MIFKLKWVYDVSTMLTVFSFVMLLNGVNNALYSAIFVIAVLGIVLCSLHTYRYSEDPVAAKKLLLSKSVIMLVILGVTFLVLGKL